MFIAGRGYGETPLADIALPIGVHDARQFEQAATAFAVVDDLLTDPTVSATDASLADLSDPGVVAPVAIRQDIVRWLGPVRPPLAGTTLGTIEVVVDETGSVVASVMRVSVSRFYDAVLLDSSRSWRYRPATKDGQPVKYRRIVVYVSRS